MKKAIFIGLLFLASHGFAYSTVFNPWTGKLDFVSTGTASAASGGLISVVPSNVIRPVLSYVNKYTIDVVYNSTTTNMACVLWPDGNTSCDTDDRTHYMLRISTNQVFSTTTTTSGQDAGVVLSTSNWFQFYAVKTSTGFAVTVTTTAPSISSFTYLNSYYGVNSWVYLGSLAFGAGESSGGTGLGWLPFVQDTPNHFRIGNRAFGAQGYQNDYQMGVLIAEVNTGTQLAVHPQPGNNIVSSQWPRTFASVDFKCYAASPGATDYWIMRQYVETSFAIVNTGSVNQQCNIFFPGAHMFLNNASDSGVNVQSNLGANIDMKVLILGYSDWALSNPYFNTLQ